MNNFRYVRGRFAKLTKNIILNGKKLGAFPLRPGTKQGSPIFLTPLQHHTQLVLANVMIKQKEIKDIILRRKIQNCLSLKVT